MPRRDGTGPMGAGPRTGRGAVNCAVDGTLTYNIPVSFGCGLGGGRGYRKMFYATGLPQGRRFRCRGLGRVYLTREDEK